MMPLNQGNHGGHTVARRKRRTMRKAPRPGEALQHQLHELRKRAGVTSQEQLAGRLDALGESFETEKNRGRKKIAKIESGERQISLDEGLAIAAALGLEPARVLFPLDDLAEVAVTPTLKVYAWQAQEWLRGHRPLTDEGNAYFDLASTDPSVAESRALPIARAAGQYMNEVRDYNRRGQLEALARLLDELTRALQHTEYIRAAQLSQDANLRDQLYTALIRFNAMASAELEAVLKNIDELKKQVSDEAAPRMQQQKPKARKASGGRSKR